MKNKIELLTALYLLLSDQIKDRLYYSLFIEIYISNKSISERVINESYYISNGTRWKSEMKSIMFKLEKRIDTIESKITDIIDKILKLYLLIYY